MSLIRWMCSARALLACAVLIAGCAQSQDKGDQAKTTAGDKGSQVAREKETKHDDWWCAEHGIPEEECSMCSAKAAKQFKDKGDWCQEHNRAKSQCFICNPKLKEVYAAKYRARYGKEPPPIEEEPTPPKENK